MTIDEAARILDLAPSASAEQLETRFNELRGKLEDKIAKAPTPGLKEKYRRNLEELTTAFETLTLAADAANLPVLERLGAVAANPASTRAPAPPTSAASTTVAPPPVPPPPARPRKSSGNSKEFLVVAAVAVLLLVAGGWFMLKVQADKAEKARIAAEAERIAAENKQREEEEKLAALERDRKERERLDRLTATIRTQLAEFRVAWEAVERDERAADRRLSELKSDLRNTRDLPATKINELTAQRDAHQRFYDWVVEHITKHPAKLARAKVEELLSARLIDDAAKAAEELQTLQVALEKEVAEHRRTLLTLEGTISLASQPANLRWELLDAFGRKKVGTTPAEIKDVAPGDATLTVIRPGFRPWVAQPLKIRSRETTKVSANLALDGAVALSSEPAGLKWELVDEQSGKRTGVTPAKIENLPPGRARITLKRPGFQDVIKEVEVQTGKTATVAAVQKSQRVQVTVAEPNSEIWINDLARPTTWRRVGKNEATIEDRAPGTYGLRLKLLNAHGATEYKTKLEIKQENTTIKQSFSFKDLSAQNITCSPCSGRGNFARSDTCGWCRGRGRVRCQWCEGKGGRNTINILTGAVTGWINCEQCRGSAVETCTNHQCERGTARWTETCTRCGGDGRVSKLQLQ